MLWTTLIVGKIISFNPVKISAKYSHLCLQFFCIPLLNKFMVYILGMLEIFICRLSTQYNTYAAA
jgi:hypothetical protein